MATRGGDVVTWLDSMACAPATLQWHPLAQQFSFSQVAMATSGDATCCAVLGVHPMSCSRKNLQLAKLRAWFRVSCIAEKGIRCGRNSTKMLCMTINSADCAGSWWLTYYVEGVVLVGSITILAGMSTPRDEHIGNMCCLTVLPDCDWRFL